MFWWHFSYVRFGCDHSLVLPGTALFLTPNLPGAPEAKWGCSTDRYTAAPKLHLLLKTLNKF